jgi:hypothetical protein
LCACLAIVGLSAGGPAAGATLRGGCTLFDFGRPGANVPGTVFRYDPTGFWSDQSNGWVRQQMTSGRITVDPSVKLVRRMRTVRLEVRPGDAVGGGPGERADIYYGRAAPIRDGATQWWAWSTRTARDFHAGSSWNVLMDFHASGDAPQANLTFEVWGRNLVFVAYGGDPTQTAWLKQGVNRVLATFVPGKRYDFVVGVHWSSDPRVGWVEVWLNGRRIVARTHVATLWAGQSAYAKLANYRPQHVARWTNVLWHAGFRHAATRAAVTRCMR